MEKGIQVTTDGQINILEFEKDESSYKVLSGAVGGYIERVSFERDLCMYINEEGKYNGSQFNPLAQKVWERYFGRTDMMMGNVIFVGGVDSEGWDEGLSPEQAGALTAILYS